MNVEFFYAKINVFRGLFSDDETTYDLLLLALKSKQIVINRNKQFIFLDIQDFDIGGRKYIYGKVVKYADLKEGVVNVEEHVSTEQVVEDRIIATCHFVIDLRENILLHTEVKNHINRISFVQIFTDLVNIGLSQKSVDISIYPMTQQYSFFQKLEELKRIDYLKLTIFPTNPDPSDLIREMDEKLRSQHVKRKTISYAAKPQGLAMDEEIKKESTYTDLGYGKGFASGEDADGKIVKVYSQKSEKQLKTKPLSLDGGISALIDEIDKLFG